MGSRNNEAMRSISTDGFEESATTLILEDMRPERNHDDDLLASQSFPGSEKNSKRQLSPNDSWITDSSRVVGGEFAVLVEEHDSTEEEDILLWGWTLKFFRGLAVFRVSCGNFVNSMPVQVIMSILLVANAVILGVLTFDLPELTISILNVTDLVMLCAFTVEITLHAVYMGPRQLLRDFWLSFDFVVILFSWCFRGSSLAVLRSFRIFRVFSIVSRWESLRTLFEAIGSIIPKMASIWLSLLLCTSYSSLFLCFFRRISTPCALFLPFPILTLLTQLYYNAQSFTSFAFCSPTSGQGCMMKVTWIKIILAIWVKPSSHCFRS